MRSYLIFNNTRIAFSLKSNLELKRTKLLFKIIGIRPLIQIGNVLIKLSIKLHFPIDRIIKNTVFKQFCGGVNEMDCLPVVEKLYSKGVFTVLDYSVEGKSNEEAFNKTRDTILNTITLAKQEKGIAFAVFKPSALGCVLLYEKISKKKSLTAQETRAWNNVVNRFNEICKKAKENEVAILIDAEESWMQNAVDDLVTLMMRTYNKDKAIVYNTLQMYRKDRLDYLKEAYKKAKIKGYFIGFKLVRGAYLEKENNQALKNAYESPICKTKTLTDNNYNTALQFIVNKINRISLFAGTHNEESCLILIKLIAENKISKKDPRIWFSQLFGMADHISFNLAKQGYNVAKYLPFGPVKEVIPYLIRRAEENSSVTGESNKEISLLAKEIKRRKKELSGNNF